MLASIRLLIRKVLAHRQAVLFAGSNVCYQFVSMACQLVVLRLIEPSLIGIWAAVALVQQYLLWTQMGVVNAMNREYPYHLGKGRPDAALAIVRTGQAYSLVNGGFLAIVFLGLAAYYAATGSGLWFAGSLTVAAMMPLQQYTNYLEGTYRAGSEFRRLSFIRLGAVPLEVVSLLLPWKLGFQGFLVRMFLLAVYPAVACHVWRPVRVGPRFERGRMRELLSTGWRLFLWSYLYRVAQSFPRLALATWGGVLLLTGNVAWEAQAVLLLGLFSPVSWMYLAFSSLTGSLSMYLYPNLTFRYARDGIAVGRIALRAGLAAMAILLPAVVVGVLLLPYVLPPLIPLYASSVRAAQFSLVAGLLECFSISTITFAATKAWRPMYVYLACALVFRAAGAFGGYHMVEDRLTGVGMGMVASSLVMAGAAWLTVRNARGAGPMVNEEMEAA